jgi:hypothetical protein
MTPAVALLTAFVSWLAVVRLPLALRMLALVLLVASVACSWMFTGFWDDPDWKAALLHNVPHGIGNLSLRPGV